MRHRASGKGIGKNFGEHLVRVVLEPAGRLAKMEQIKHRHAEQIGFGQRHQLDIALVEQHIRPSMSNMHRPSCTPSSAAWSRAAFFQA